MISFYKYNSIIKDIVKIKLKKEDYIQTVLIAAVMLEVTWLRKNLRSDEGEKMLSKVIQKCFIKKIANKSQFL